MKTILFPTDFSDLANKALRSVISFAQKFEAKIIIYHVYHRPFTHNDVSQTASSLVGLERKIDSQFKKLLDENNELKQVEHEFRKELGLFIKSIVNVSNTNPIDLIIMVTKGAIGLGELWGSKTAEIVKQVKAPVLVMPDNTTSI